MKVQEVKQDMLRESISVERKRQGNPQEIYDNT